MISCYNVLGEKMIILRNIKIPYDKDQKFLREKIKKEINKKDFDFKIHKKSFDARKGLNFVYQVVIDLDLDDIDVKIQKRLKNDLADFQEEKLEVENKNKIESAVIVGTGPAGLFLQPTSLPRRGSRLLSLKGARLSMKELQTLTNFTILEY